MQRWQLGLFVVLDICFFSTLVGMSACASHSKLVYVSDWIMDCKQSDNAQQALPILVAVMFVLIVHMQLDWMVRVACGIPHPPSFPLGAAVDTVADADAVQQTPPLVLSIVVIACKLACVLGIAFVFVYDHEYPTNRRGLVYTHYYGVVLVCVGLTGLLQTTWWQLEQTLNNKKLAPDAHLTAIQDLEHRSFFVGDVFLFVVVIFFFTATLLSSSDNTGSMHNGAVISEFVTLFLLWLQLVYLFWRCCALLAVEPITLTNDTHRLAITFVVLMIPYTVMQSIN
jgi:hypothetical protein